MTTGPRVLVVEDDPVLGPAMIQRLRLEGFVPRLATTGAIALQELAARQPDLVVSDIRLPDMTGEDVFRRMIDDVGLLPVFFVTAFGEVAQAVRLVKAGARDYLTKPVDVDALVLALRQAGGPPPAAVSAATPAPAQNAPHTSSVMARLDQTLHKLAPRDLPVLLRGETGVGKEVAARRLHALGARGGPFVAVNCAAIPKDLLESTLFGHEKGAFTGALARAAGLAEQAAGGTLFLDEIAELPLDLQPKLLRLVQERRFRPVGMTEEKNFTGRLVTATHADLAGRVAAGTFREDLYFRINVVDLVIPPLRARPEEIEPFAVRFLVEADTRFGGDTHRFSADAIDTLRAYDWPGNVRELRNRIERAAALADGPLIDADDLFPERSFDEPVVAHLSQGGIGDAAKAAVRRRVREALAETGGNRAEAARLLGVSRTTVWKYAKPDGDAER